MGTQLGDHRPYDWAFARTPNCVLGISRLEMGRFVPVSRRLSSGCLEPGGLGGYVLWGPASSRLAIVVAAFVLAQVRGSAPSLPRNIARLQAFQSRTNRREVRFLPDDH
jgi:hypothetical protein